MHDKSALIESINDEETEIGIEFSGKLRVFLKIINCMEYLDDWMFYSVLNKMNHRVKYGYFKTNKHIMNYRLVPTDPIFIAVDMVENHLVLQVNNGVSLTSLWRCNGEYNEN